MPNPLNLNRVEMPRQLAEERAHNFDEVALGYTLEQMREEASRCLSCVKKNCTRGCPVGIDITSFITALCANDLPRALAVIKEKNALPGICGRVCPQETQCESQCLLEKKGAPVAIGRLERYVADWARKHPQTTGERSATTGKRVAVVGSGPAGLTCAATLAQAGHQVTLLEALHVAGGVLMYGIPEFRLPKDIVQEEVKYVCSLGVKLELNSVVGKIDTVDELLQNGYNAVFLGTGAGLPTMLGVPGENLSGVYSANEYLTRVNLMKAYRFPEYDTPVRRGQQVAVIGGGNVAMDAARCALRLGAQKVSIVYRRSDTEMPARREEIENAREEGVQFVMLSGVKGFAGDERGWLVAMDCFEMELGEPDASGRRRPIPKVDSDFRLSVDVAVVALGTSPNPLIAQTTSGLETTSHGTLIADEATGRTNKKGVWAGGDVVTGSATVISAMGAARRAADDIDQYLRA
ncbi:MAG: NADPH-dependent glutamate synthase [Dehalococcoidia bacterium]|nr:NADPH-dependent glutamate synthase [Dehalococcoidia bacterium]